MVISTTSYLNIANFSTLVFITMLIFLHEIFTVGAFLYLSLYTSYVLCYALKHYLFRNEAFERQLNFYDIVLSVPILFGVYWALPYFAIVLARDAPLSNAQIFISVVLFCTGLATMLVSDAENYYMMQHCPERLRDAGLNKLVLAPNVLGEGMLYLSFTILSNSWVTMLLLLAMWITLFYPINVMKSQSVTEYIQNFEQAKRTGGGGLTYIASYWGDSRVGDPTSSDSDTTKSGEESGEESSEGMRGQTYGSDVQVESKFGGEGCEEGARPEMKGGEIASTLRRRSTRLGAPGSSNAEDRGKRMPSEEVLHGPCPNEECGCDNCGCSPCHCGMGEAPTAKAPPANANASRVPSLHLKS